VHYWNNGSGGWGPWLGMAIMMAVFAVAIAWVIVTLVRHAGPSSPKAEPPPAVQPSAASAILDERFARGEIDAEEYTHRRALLGGGNAG
jgi:putative membrane protein